MKSLIVLWFLEIPERNNLYGFGQLLTIIINNKIFAVREHFMAHNIDTQARPQLEVCEPAHKYRTHKPKQKQNEASY